jgi:hypothetical protein
MMSNLQRTITQLMKPKLIIGLLLVLVGTNLFTFATTRYLTTKHVLTRAEERMDAALKKEGLYESVFPKDRPLSVEISLAISQAGGWYYWENDAVIYWGGAILLVITGLAATRYEQRKKSAG